MSATSSYIGGNPLKVTSGWTNAILATGKWKIQRLYWEQPDMTSTSALVITKNGSANMIYAHMMVEVSGQSQQLNLGDQWWESPFINCMPSGTLWIYLDD